ncbi:MAG: hypothetical protein OHK0053_25210 [Microscillaceae bacterium]
MKKIYLLLLFALITFTTYAQGREGGDVSDRQRAQAREQQRKADSLKAIMNDKKETNPPTNIENPSKTVENTNQDTIKKVKEESQPQTYNEAEENYLMTLAITEVLTDTEINKNTEIAIENVKTIVEKVKSETDSLRKEYEALKARIENSPDLSPKEKEDLERRLKILEAKIKNNETTIAYLIQLYETLQAKYEKEKLFRTYILVSPLFSHFYCFLWFSFSFYLPRSVKKNETL